MKRLLQRLALIALLCGLGYFASFFRTPPPDGMPSREAFARAAHFPFTAPAEREASIVGRYPELKAGMTKGEVSAILGEPDFSELVNRFKLPDIMYLGTSWQYVLGSNTPWVGTDGSDRYLFIFFDLEGKADWIVPVGVAGLEEKGAPRGRS